MNNHFRYYLINLLSLSSTAIAWVAFAYTPINSISPSSVENRITQLERISGAHSQFLTQLYQQVSDNQSDIDFLRGEIQENQHQLNEIVERQKQILLKINTISNRNNEITQSDIAASK